MRDVTFNPVSILSRLQNAYHRGVLVGFLAGALVLLFFESVRGWPPIVVWLAGIAFMVLILLVAEMLALRWASIQDAQHLAQSVTFRFERKEEDDALQ